MFFLYKPFHLSIKTQDRYDAGLNLNVTIFEKQPDLSEFRFQK